MNDSAMLEFFDDLGSSADVLREVSSVDAGRLLWTKSDEDVTRFGGTLSRRKVLRRKAQVLFARRDGRNGLGSIVRFL